MSRGQLFIVSAPSGAGKTTILKKVITDLPGLSFSISHTTRPPRKGEVAGQDYYFINRSEFCRMSDNQEFIEFAEVHNNLYGTSVGAVINQLEAGTDVILDIDVQGANQVMARSELRPITIFIAPPSADELKRRLKGRDTDSEQTIELRLKNAAIEMSSLNTYHHVIINDKLGEAIEMVEAVILAQRSKTRKNRDGSPITAIESDN